MNIHYLEVVTPDVASVCKSYELTQNVRFGEPDEMLGGARTGTLPDGCILGIRAPLRADETPVVRPYWLVDDIDTAVSIVKAQGAEIAVPPVEIPSKGKFCIYILGSIEHGFWQR
ncbi:VOC family protein [Vibrio methylphosphonaticus]|uniref:VOC family protein n=1 Tax=Vibrio methylphosphonaticus TaxID=2946866 RepID=UPI00202A3003|nr:hydroxylase [Vibrio methylphosphonaticus]MCL9774202.1 hydroxylase [Vibrio methylphosphonaticus]